MVCRFAPAGILFGSGFNHSDKRDGVLPGQGGLPPGAAPNRFSIHHAKLKLWAYGLPKKTLSGPNTPSGSIAVTQIQKQWLSGKVPDLNVSSWQCFRAANFMILPKSLLSVN